MKQFFYLVLCMLFIPALVKSQGGNPPPGGGGSIFKPDNSVFAKMSEIIPPPPDASAISRYGGVNVELNTGNVNKSIELKAITNKSLSVPVGLFFKSNGLNVNQYPSRAGMGWAINVGGQISRVIHGADDFLSQRYLPAFSMQPNETDQNTTDYCFHLKNDGQKDAEPDMFSFSAGQYSGKFIFDNSGNILQLPASNLKMAYNTQPLVDGTWTFKIITPDGVQYIYGGDDVNIEKTKRGSTSQGAQFRPTVWHLNKIQHPIGYYITFTYVKEQIGPYLDGINQTQYKLSPDASAMVCGDGDCADGMMPTVYDAQSYITAETTTLSEINTSYGSKATFEYSAQHYPEKLVTAINYFNEDNKRINRYVFSYNIVQTSTGQNLPFLTTVKEYNEQNASLNNGHSFEYYNLNNIPTRVSNYSQDHWGFFNGKYNTTLVPKPDDDELAYDFPQATANREPDPGYAVNGMLSKIIYPTGGKDTIEYEANTIEDYQDVNPYASVYQVVIGTTSNPDPELASTSFAVGYQPRIMLTAQCTYLGTQGYGHQDDGRVRIQNVNTSAYVYDNYFFPNEGPSTIFVTLSPGTYQVIVTSHGIDIKTNATVKYRTGVTADWQYVTTPVGGVRVKRTTTSNNAVNNPITKRYYYGTFGNLNYSSATPVAKPKYFTPYNLIVGIVTGGCSVTYRSYSDLALNYSSINRLYLSDGKIQEYNSVIESIGGDNFENGAVEHKFNTVNDFAAQPIRGTLDMNAPLTNTYYASKGEVETNTYANKPSGLVPVSKLVRDITIDTRNFNDNWFLSVNQSSSFPCVAYNGSGSIVGPYPINHMNYTISKYYITSAWKYLSKTTETKYDENGLYPSTTVTNYYYDDDRNLMLSRTETLNSKGELMKQQNKYPHDFTATGNVYEDMVNKNMVASPVEVKTFKDGQTLFTQTSNYSNSWFGDKHVVAIDNVAFQKAGFSNETRFKYFSYNTDGNPTELSKQDDVKQDVIWDYKGNYPVAKVINATQADIAYSSFEADGKGNWTFTGTTVADATAPTGKMKYVLNGSNNITKSGLTSSTTYIVSYWIKGASPLTITGTISNYPVGGRSFNGWKYFEHKITGQSSVTIGSSGSIDELRLYPEKAQMSTQTYESLVGMTSQCDVNNRITYYEYDGFGRLILVRDQDKNITKKICYNYAGQVENCNLSYVNTLPNWQNTSTALRCQLNAQGQNTGYQEQEQIDTNPNSPSYNQTQWTQVGLNTTACPPTVNANLTSTNVQGFSGYTASYYNTTTGFTYNFAVPTTIGLQPLGSVPEGSYTLTISKSGINMYGTFKSGCFKFGTFTGASPAVFYNVAVSSTTCNSITVDISGE